MKTDLEKFTNVKSELWFTRQRLKLWSKEAAILESGKMKSPRGYRERRLPAWEITVPLERKSWRMQGYPQKGLLREHGLESRLNEFQFTSVTTLRTERMFGEYN